SSVSTCHIPPPIDTLSLHDALPIFERYVKNRIIAESISLPEIPADVLARYPAVVEAIETLEAEGFPIFAYDGSLGGQYPVICVRSEEHTSELQSRFDLVCCLLLEKK